MITARSRTAVALALSFALAGCGNGGSDDPGEVEPGPLDEVLADIYGGSDGGMGPALQMRVEEMIAECMAEQGFDYIPVDYAQAGVIMSTNNLDVAWGTREFAEKYGYGVTTEDLMVQPSEEWVDPNEEYLMSLSETEQAAYSSALWGEQPIPLGDDVAVEYNSQEAGCQGRAQYEVYQTAPGLEDAAYQALMNEMNAMSEGIMNDPRLTELDPIWATCMAEAGHPGFITIGDAENSIYDMVSRAYDTDSGVLGDDELAELTQLEIELAVADFDCRDEVDYDRIQRAVDAEAQQRFYDAHKDELEAWRDAAVGARG